MSVDDTRVPLTPPGEEPSDPPPGDAEEAAPRFAYVAQTEEGERLRGVVSAASSLEVVEALKAGGMVPLDVRPEEALEAPEEEEEADPEPEPPAAGGGSGCRTGCMLAAIGLLAPVVVVVALLLSTDWSDDLDGAVRELGSSVTESLDELNSQTLDGSEPLPGDPSEAAPEDTGDADGQAAAEQQAVIESGLRTRIEPGMTPDAVKAITGEPGMEISMGQRATWTFATFKVRFENDHVVEVIDIDADTRPLTLGDRHE